MAAHHLNTKAQRHAAFLDVSGVIIPPLTIDAAARAQLAGSYKPVGAYIAPPLFDSNVVHWQKSGFSSSGNSNGRSK